MLYTEDYNIYNRLIDFVIRELASDRTITRQQEATADDPEEKYHATENLDRISKDFRDSGFSVYFFLLTTIFLSLNLFHQHLIYSTVLTLIIHICQQQHHQPTF